MSPLTVKLTIVQERLKEYQTELNRNKQTSSRLQADFKQISGKLETNFKQTSSRLHVDFKQTSSRVYIISATHSQSLCLVFL